MSFFDRFRRTPIQTKDYGSQRIKQQRADGGFAAPESLLKIFTGEDNGFNLASGSVSKQIQTASRLCGVPTIINEGYEWLKKLAKDEAQTIHTMALVNGTHWAVPKQAGRSVSLEHILDSDIGNDNLRVNLDTGELEAVYQETQIRYPVGEYAARQVQETRRRSWTKDTIREERGKIRREEPNLLQILPTPFAFGDTVAIRGTSAYAGQLRMIRNLHELRFNRDSILSKARPKFFIQANDIDAFIERNRRANAQGSVYDPYEADAVVCEVGEEARWDAYPVGFFQEINNAIQDNQAELLTSGLLPEMFSGRALVGNYASAEYNVIQGVEFINSMREGFTKAWDKLLNDLARTHAMANGETAERIEFGWNAFDMMTATNKAQVLVGIVQAVQTCAASGLPIELVFDMVKTLNPELDYATAEEMQEAIFRTKQETPFDEEIELWR